jgi:hypothetical protein
MGISSRLLTVFSEDGYVGIGGMGNRLCRRVLDKQGRHQQAESKFCSCYYIAGLQLAEDNMIAAK